MKPICVFYHCLLYWNSPDRPIPLAMAVVGEQMRQLRLSGLLDAATQVVVGINGGQESIEKLREIMPKSDKLSVIGFGLSSKSENMTIFTLEQWLPGHEGWNVLYAHAKGSTHSIRDAASDRWRGCMMRNLVNNWKRCVSDLDGGFDSVGCHWLTPPHTPPGQYIWGGNFWWAKSDYLITLPSIAETARVKESGIYSAKSRYEAEVWLGNGPYMPRVKDYHPNFDPITMSTCVS